ncbi:MAG: hypothetical protein IKO88_04240 [Bacteroidales bacterium]|nr:hypothetical protein [Bacteroidales bacterium]
MEKSRTEILSEIQETLAMLKARIADIEEKLAVLEQAPEPEPEPAEEPVAEQVPMQEQEAVELPAEEIVDIAPEEPASAAEPAEEDLPAAEADLDPIDISLDEIEVDMAPEAPAVPEAKPAAAAPEAVPAPSPAATPAPAPAAPEEPDPEEELLMDGPARTNINDKQGRNVRKAVMDVVGQKLAWKTAMPGTPVKNVISAISLNDRVLFINTLFKEDPMAFQEAIAAFNGMASFDEAEEYVKANYPDWNLNSDLVFRLMMAVRRKLK